MIIKLDTKQYNFLKDTLGKDRAELFVYLSNGNGITLEVKDEIAIEIRDWVGEKLQKVGSVSYTHLTLPTNREV